MKNLKRFNLNSDYNNYIQSENALLPNVSFVKEILKVFYNPVVGDSDKPSNDPLKNYFSIENKDNKPVAVSISSFGEGGGCYSYIMDNNILSYKIDNGDWMPINHDSTDIKLLQNSVMSLRCNISPEEVQSIDIFGEGLFSIVVCGYYVDGENMWTDYEIPAKVRFKGNIMSLLMGDNFIDSSAEDLLAYRQGVFTGLILGDNGGYGYNYRYYSRDLNTNMFPSGIDDAMVLYYTDCGWDHEYADIFNKIKIFEDNVKVNFTLIFLEGFDWDGELNDPYQNAHDIQITYSTTSGMTWEDWITCETETNGEIWGGDELIFLRDDFDYVFKLGPHEVMYKLVNEDGTDISKYDLIQNGYLSIWETFDPIG